MTLTFEKGDSDSEMAINEERPYPVGIEYNSLSDLKNCFEAATVNFGFDSCIMPIAHPLFKREFLGGKCKGSTGPFTRSDIILVSYDWQLIIGKFSPYIDCDSSDDSFRKSSEAAFMQELNYAIHLSLPAVIFSIRGPNVENLARLLHTRYNNHTSQQDFLKGHRFFQFWIRVPLQCPSVAANYFRSNSDPDLPEPDPWHWWNKLRQLANSEKNIAVALEIGPDLPDEEVLTRWLGEPVRCALVPTSIFLTNKRGYPVLSRPHQAFVKALTVNDCKIFITGVCRHDNIINYRKYIEHVARRTALNDPLMAYTQGYEDYLQYPLQPLSDNLESQTYEIFEKDPIKYKSYQDAIYYALLDRVPVDKIETNVQVLVVAGAGRGPLVGAALNASKNSDRKVKIYALEKNPNAIVTLYAQKEEIWGDSVTIVPGDMRSFDPPEKVDILISELLGSFGDNELSPECLDGVQKVLKDDGISIPESYTSYLSPIQSMRLFSEIRLYKERNKHPLAHFEMPYVVHQKNKFQISSVKPLFTFTHPNKDELKDNARYNKLSFEIKTDCVLHGFSGFFTAVLYKDVTISIEPSSHTPGMFSWFPVYFPIREPINLKASDELVVHFWRCCNSKSVWYEWCISKPCLLSIHNSSGRSYSIGLH